MRVCADYLQKAFSRLEENQAESKTAYYLKKMKGHFFIIPVIICTGSSNKCSKEEEV